LNLSSLVEHVLQIASFSFVDEQLVGSIGHKGSSAYLNAKVRFLSVHDEALSDQQLQHLMAAMTSNISICSTFQPYGESLTLPMPL
jgi:hypothetical protein